MLILKTFGLSLLILLCVLITPVSYSQNLELQNFLDEFFSINLEKLNNPGTVFVIVQDNEIVASRGFGYANREKEKFVDPKTSIFPLESVTKIFTTTAVMQLIEQGLLSLDDKVQDYLQDSLVQVDEELTVRHLLTHTTGLDDNDIGAYARSAEEIMDISSFLEKNLPPTVMPHGEVINYSNYGMAIAGYLIELVSGLSYQQYITKNILQPLEMHNSGFNYPDNLVQGYDQENQPQSPYYHHYQPAGGLKASGEDMAKFIIAKLQKDSAILEANTNNLIKQQHFTHHPALPGITLGYFERYINGKQLLIHGGDAYPTFATFLALLPQDNLGFFLAVNNSNKGHQLREKLTLKLMDYLYSKESISTIEPLAEFQQLVKKIPGNYLPVRQGRSSLQKLGNLFNQLKVEVIDDSIFLNHEHYGSGNWKEITPLVFFNETNQGRLTFREINGKITHMFIDGHAFNKANWYEASNLHLTLILVFIFIFSYGTIKALIKWRANKLSQSTKLLGFLSFFSLIYLIGTGVFFVVYGLDIIYGLPLVFRLFMLIPYILILLAIATLVFWLKEKQVLSKIDNITHLTILVTSLIYFVFLSYWNLV